MSAVNSSEFIPSRIKGYSKLDESKMTTDVAKDLNTYRNWGSFQLLLDNVIKRDGTEGEMMQGAGVRSIFNNSNATYTDGGTRDIRLSNNVPLLDAPATRVTQRRNMSCTIKDLVAASESGEMGRAIYSYSDFAYCTYLGRVPNNYLITLRRFPLPCGDHINFTFPQSDHERQIQQHMPDIGRLVTWIGTPGNKMSSILKYDVKLNFVEKTSEADMDVSGDGDQSSPLAQMFNAADPAYQKEVQQGYAGSGIGGNMDSVLGGNWGESAGSTPYKEIRSYRDKNKVYGPLDVIKRTNQRAQGIEMNQPISLTFDYSLRSYDGINGRAAMMDLLSNILAVTYTTGKWWGGSYRYTGAHQSNVFANLPIFKLASEGGLSDPGAVWHSFSDSITMVGNDIKAKGDGSLLGGIVETLKGVGGMLLGGLLNKLGRPQKFTAASLLTDAPVGLWHLTVGNPKAPIMQMGNMILDTASIEHYGPLGIDDFPTGIRVTVTLKHATDRDTARIERMYMKGDDRYYVPMSREVMNMYKSATDIKTGVTEDWHQYDYDHQSATSTSKSMDEASGVSDKVRGVLMKHFGTTNTKNITTASAEAAWGSCDARKQEGTDNAGK